MNDLLKIINEILKLFNNLLEYKSKMDKQRASKELPQLSLRENKIVKKTLNKFRVTFDDIKTAVQFISFIDNKIQIKFTKSDKILNWFGYILGCLLLFLGLIGFCLNMHVHEYQIAIQCFISMCIGGMILNIVFPYFVAKKLKRLLN